MRYAVILAGGSGTRLWPWSRSGRPKQLLPLMHGRSLLQLAFDRLSGAVPQERLLVCTDVRFAEAICSALDGLGQEQVLGEPVGRDTGAALACCAAILHRRDPEAVMAVCTADHVIEPESVFRQKLEVAFALAEKRADAIVTFGVAPTTASTAYGYLELGEAAGGAVAVRRFLEKPELPAARQFFSAGRGKYLWNSGMFVWKAKTLLDCLCRHEHSLFDGAIEIADAYDTPRRDEVLSCIYPKLKKISIDYAVMEPASRDPLVEVLAIPLELRWHDIGSWNAFADICEREGENVVAATSYALLDCDRVFVASDDPRHLVSAVGCKDLIIVHTADATLVCRSDRAEDVKKLRELLGERFGDRYF